MIRVPHVFVQNLKYNGRSVNRLIVAHPRAVQYIQHYPDRAELKIRYISGEEMGIFDREKPETIRNLFEHLVYQVKDCSD